MTLRANNESAVSPLFSVGLFRAYLEGLSGYRPTLTVSLSGLASGIGVSEDYVLDSLKELMSTGELGGVSGVSCEGQLTITFNFSAAKSLSNRLEKNRHSVGHRRT